MPKESVPQTPRKEKRFGGRRKVSASVCRLNFRVVTRAPTRAVNVRSAAARPVTKRCGCWVLIRRTLGGRAKWRALPKWYPSSPAAMCRLWTGGVRARDVGIQIHFPFESHGRATSTALSPSGEKPRHPIAPLIKGSWRRRRLGGQPLKKRPGIHRIPGLHTYYLLLITYYLAQCLHTSSPFSASSTIVLPAARSPLRISRAISVSALLWR